MNRDNPRLLIWGDIEKCVRHAERMKNVLAKVGLQSLAADSFDQDTEPVRTDSIFPSCSRIKQKWRLQKPLVALTHRRDRSGRHIAVHLRIERFVDES